MREKLEVRINNWADIKGLEFFYGFDFCREGQWYHAAREGELLLFDNEQDRNNAMTAFQKGMSLNYVVPMTIPAIEVWGVKRGDCVLYVNPEKGECLTWLHEKGLVFESNESHLASGYEVALVTG